MLTKTKSNDTIFLCNGGSSAIFMVVEARIRARNENGDQEATSQVLNPNFHKRFDLGHPLWK